VLHDCVIPYSFFDFRGCALILFFSVRVRDLHRDFLFATPVFSSQLSSRAKKVTMVSPVFQSVAAQDLRFFLVRISRLLLA
jgi:hypothetical protein